MINIHMYMICMVYVIMVVSTWGGHYTAYVKNADNNWYHFNDTSVTKLTSNIEHSLISTTCILSFLSEKKCNIIYI